jgi:C4-dicarboxylate transporter DctM subunit
LVTPPGGLNLFVAHALTKIPVMTIARGAAPFIVVFFIALMVITFVPAVALMLL